MKNNKFVRGFIFWVIILFFLSTCLPIVDHVSCGGTQPKGKILVYSTSITSQYNKTYFDEDLPAILEDYGYSVDITDRFSTPEITYSLLSTYDQLWFLSTYSPSTSQLSELEVETILNFLKSDHGLLIMANGDHNANYSDDANQISIPLGVVFWGNLSYDYDVDNQTISPLFFNYYKIIGITTGLKSISTNGNWARMAICSDLVYSVAYMNFPVIVALIDESDGKVIFDCSFSRLENDKILIGDTPQYVRNIADWLSGNQPGIALDIGNASNINNKGDHPWTLTFSNVLTYSDTYSRNSRLCCISYKKKIL